MSEFIDVLLAESELSDDRMLRDLLGELEQETTTVRPMPSAALSELLRPKRAPSIRAGARVARRRPSFAARSAIIVSVAVIGAVGLGAGAAAASPEARSAIGAGVAAIAHLFEPAPASELPAPTKRGAHPPVVGSASEPSAPTPSHGAPGAIHSYPGSGSGPGSTPGVGARPNTGAAEAAAATAAATSGAGSAVVPVAVPATVPAADPAAGAGSAPSNASGPPIISADVQSGHGGGSGHGH